MTDNNALSDDPPLVRAAHRLRETENLRDQDEVNARDAMLEKVDKALDDIDEFTDEQFEEMVEDVL
jgi:TPP-dependent pyruvate/acetoin dehydrogenase alpha subunit